MRGERRRRLRVLFALRCLLFLCEILSRSGSLLSELSLLGSRKQQLGLYAPPLSGLRLLRYNKQR
jgi:hypothetical protein